MLTSYTETYPACKYQMLAGIQLQSHTVASAKPSLESRPVRVSQRLGFVCHSTPSWRAPSCVTGPVSTEAGKSSWLPEWPLLISGHWWQRSAENEVHSQNLQVINTLSGKIQHQIYLNLSQFMPAKHLSAVSCRIIAPDYATIHLTSIHCPKLSFSHVQLFATPWPVGRPGFSVHGILQVRIMDWVAIPFSGGSSWPRDWTWSPALQADSLRSELPGKPKALYNLEAWYPLSSQKFHL